MPSLPLRAACAALAVALLAGCTGTADDHRGDAGDPGEVDRVETVQQLRRDVGPAAAALGTATATVAERFDELHATWPADLDARRAAVDALTDAALPGLEAALDGYGPDLAGDAAGPDAASARTALADSRDAAAALLAAAEVDLELLATATDAEGRLRELVAAWEEPGSRNDQLERLSATAEEASALADELAEVEDVPACAAWVERREEAARAVAAASRELRELVVARRGSTFDERRDELLQDPYDLGELLAEADRGDLACWREDGPVLAALADVEAALAELEDALNPAGLAAG